MPLKVFVCFEFGIGVRGQHLAVCIDVDPLALGLLQEQVQVAQIVPRYDDKRSLFHLQRDLRGRRDAIRLRIGSIQQRHALQVDFSHLKGHWQQFLWTSRFTHGAQTFIEKSIDGFIRISQHHGMIGIGCHTTQAKEDQRLEGADVFLRRPQILHVIIVVARDTRVTLREQRLLFPVHCCNLCKHGIIVKVDIGDGRKQALDHRAMGALGGRIFLGSTGQPDQRARQCILQMRCGRLLAAYALTAGAPSAPRRLFALKAKHTLFHLFLLLPLLLCVRKHDHQQHFKCLLRIDGMRFLGRHDKRLTRHECVVLPIHGESAGALQHQHHGIARRNMCADLFIFVKAKQRQTDGIVLRKGFTCDLSWAYGNLPCEWQHHLVRNVLDPYPFHLCFPSSSPVPFVYGSRMRPSVEMVTTCQGMHLPLFCKAVTAACSKPPQHGTSMRTIVRLLMSF